MYPTITRITTDDVYRLVAELLERTTAIPEPPVAAPLPARSAPFNMLDPKQRG